MGEKQLMIISYACIKFQFSMIINYATPHLRGGAKSFKFLMIINYAAPCLVVHKVSILDDY